MLGIDESKAIDLLEAHGWDTDRAAELYFHREANPTPDKTQAKVDAEAVALTTSGTWWKVLIFYVLFVTMISTH